MQNVQHFCALKDVKPNFACTESGVGRNFLNDIRRGQTPSVAKVQMLAAYLGVTTSQLLGEPDPKENKNSPDSISAAEAARDEKLITLLTQLTPEESTLVQAFVQGLIASR